MGCLKYPSWLIRDWDPVNYNWNVEAYRPKWYSGRPENTPDELVFYRAMYAQFVEMLLPTDPADSTSNKMGADITRLSLITASLEVAINRPEAMCPMIAHLFRTLTRTIGDGDETYLSNSESSRSNFGSGLSDIDDSNTAALASRKDVKGQEKDEETEPTEAEEAFLGLSNGAKQVNMGTLSQKSDGHLHQSSGEDVDNETHETGDSALNTTSREGPVSKQRVGLEKASSQLGLAKSDTARDFAAIEATEEANHKLRMVLASFKKPKIASTHLKSKKHQAARYEVTAITQAAKSKSEPSKQKDRFYELLDIANKQLRTMIANLQKPEDANANLEQNIPQVTGVEDDESESEESYQSTSDTSSPDLMPNAVAADVQINLKGGRWFETPRGSLKSVEDGKRVGDSSDDQEGNSILSSYYSQNTEGPSEVAAGIYEDIDVAQVVLPSLDQPEAVIVRHQSASDEEAHDDEEEYGLKGFIQKDNGAEHDDCEVRDKETSLVGVEKANLKGKAVDRGSASSEGSEHPGPVRMVDSGNFAMSEVFVALGNGNLDEVRMRKLREGFMMMLDEALGRL